MHHPWMRRRHELEERLDLMRRMRAFMQSVRGAEPRQGEHISHEEFDLLTAKLRAACFAVVIQQQAAERAAAEALATLQFPPKGTLMSADCQ